MSDVNITINGGNNQILPNATEAKQIFIGDKFAEKLISEKSPKEESTPEVDKLSIYINKENIPGYLAQIGGCRPLQNWQRSWWRWRSVSLASPPRR